MRDELADKPDLTRNAEESSGDLPRCVSGMLEGTGICGWISSGSGKRRRRGFRNDGTGYAASASLDLSAAAAPFIYGQPPSDPQAARLSGALAAGSLGGLAFCFNRVCFPVLISLIQSFDRDPSGMVLLHHGLSTLFFFLALAGPPEEPPGRLAAIRPRVKRGVLLVKNAAASF